MDLTQIGFASFPTAPAEEVAIDEVPGLVAEVKPEPVIGMSSPPASPQG